MESFSEIATPETRSARLRHPPFFKDHHLDGKPVLPAVEAMEALAAASREQSPDAVITDIAGATFEKFLFLDPRANTTLVYRRLDRLDNGSTRAMLQTKTRAPHAAITRTKVHAAMTFCGEGRPAAFPPLDVAAAPAGICASVAPEKLYAELVPFGRAYHNVIDALFLGNDGAIARVGSPRPPDGRQNLILGSPYPLDAAFHAACAWGQYAAHVVAFPVAIDHRKIVRPTRLDKSYITRVIPREVTGATLVCDIFIFDRRGNLCEVSSGVCMRDISGGHTRPPDWIRKQNRDNRLATLEGSGRDLVVIDRRCIAPFADAALSALERQRAAPMAPRRGNSFLAARLALKRLSRGLSGETTPRSPREINTVQADSPKPVCPAVDRPKPLSCSVSHDDRFAVAVVADKPVGIDVEQITPKAFKNRRLYTNDSEAALMRLFPEGETAAAVRVWSAKEAAAKALDMPLAQAWERVRLTDLGVTESRLQVEDLGTCSVLHDTVDDHLFTLLTL